MTKQAANRLIRHLERRGYLRLEPDPVDRRAADRPAHWPRLGRIGVIRVTVEEVERAWSQRLGKRGFEELRRALKELAG